MNQPYLWIKTFHIVFVTSWFAGLFYLPRIFVNLAMVDNADARAQLLAMARKLFRFMTILAVIALALGLALWLGYGVTGHWLHAKLALVILLIAYHVTCRLLLQNFERGRNTHTHRWFRYFNEVPVLLLIGIVALVIIKPF